MWTLPENIFLISLITWKRKFPLNLFYFEFVNFLLLRYLWTLPGRKTCMMFSSLSITTPISNFKSISLTALEFWSRYHQKTSF
jgi:hypothetical protein